MDGRKRDGRRPASVGMAVSERQLRRVLVDKDNCTSCGLCADTDPAYFRMDEFDLAESHNGGASVNDAVVPEGDKGRVDVAIEDCPGECIHWRSA